MEMREHALMLFGMSVHVYVGGEDAKIKWSPMTLTNNARKIIPGSKH